MQTEEKKAEISGEYGRILFSWKVPEYEKYERSRNWYITAITLSMSLLFYSFFTLNFLFALIVATATLVIIMHHSQEPPQVDIRITEDGLQVGRRFYDYDAIKDFAIVYKPRQGVKQIYFEFKNWYMHRLSLPLHDINPIPLRQALLDFLEEDKEREEPPLTESLAKLLKL